MAHHSNEDESKIDPSHDDLEKGRGSVDLVDLAAAENESARNPFWLAVRKGIRFIGGEETGIERIPEEMRTDQNPSDLGSTFCAANFTTSTLALGFLGPTTFSLGWWDSFLSVVFFNLLGGLCAAITASFGPKLGLRTMILPRYSFGWWPSKILAFLCMINMIGWGIVNAIAGAAVLSDAGRGQLSLTIAVLIICLAAIIFALLGYKVLHTWFRFTWVVMLVAFIFLAGFGGRFFLVLPMPSGPVEASNVLSFGTTIVGYQVAWLLKAADFGVYMREDISPWVTSGWTFAGLSVSQILIEALGAAVGTLSGSPDPVPKRAYAERGIGGLVGYSFSGLGPHAVGFGRFIEVVLSFSAVTAVTTDIYSMGLNAQMITKKLLVVPRLIWCLIGGAAILICSMVGRNELESVMRNFMNVCAYWIVPFCSIFLLEHFIWRRNYDYDLTAWNDRTKLPFGFAASTAWIISTGIAVIAMSQTWWIGPIAANIGKSPSGTDISWILAAGASVVLYIPLRMVERRWTRY